MPDDLRLLVGRKIYTGFESLSVSRSFEAAAGTFSLTVSTRDPWPILPGMEVRILLGASPLALGFVDKVSPSLSESGRTITVEGRDRTAELVDCSAELGVSEWYDVSLQQIAEQLCAPFSILALYQGTSVERFPVFALQPGETCWEALERACRLRGVLAFASSGGNLLLTRPTERLEAEVLREGENVLSAEASIDHTDRFAEYVVRGQQFGTDETAGEFAAHLEGRAVDFAIRKQRRLVLIAEGNVSDGTAQARAEWEATTRAARSLKVSATVQGWRQRGGKIWAPNQRLQVDIPSLLLESQMLISSVTFGLSGGEGTTTKLELMRPDAFTPQPGVDQEEDPFGALVEAGEE